MGPRRQASLAANPLLIGAVTTLVVVVAIYLSYNANSGLPFVPTYNIKAALPDAEGLINGNEVRIGGTRVGIVANMVPYQEPRTGRTVAIAEMKLQKSVQPLPADTTDSVLSRSSIGLKYLALFKGTSSETLKPGQTIALSRFQEPVQLQEFFNIWDKRTRIASQENLIDGGNGFAGRGEGLNRTIHALRPLTEEAIPVLRNLAEPRTGFGELWRDLNKPAEQTAPVAQLNAAFYSDLDTFLRAWASVSGSVERAIEGGPPSLEQATYSLPHERPFYEKSTEFMRLLRPSAVALRRAAPVFASAVEVGTRTEPEAVSLNERLATFLANLRSFSEDPSVELGLSQLRHTAEVGNAVVAGIAPEQATCNYVTLTFRNLASLLGQDIGIGTMARVLPVLAPSGPNSEGSPASAPAAGPSPEQVYSPPHTQEYNNNFVHVNPYPNVAGPGQPKVCEAGNETYEPGKTVIGHAPHIVSVREITKRKDSLYPETYPYSSATLKALGISSAKKGGHG
jgi:ABC-type transporter Mla subunit MlaD